MRRLCILASDSLPLGSNHYLYKSWSVFLCVHLVEWFGIKTMSESRIAVLSAVRVKDIHTHFHTLGVCVQLKSGQILWKVNIRHSLCPKMHISSF